MKRGTKFDNGKLRWFLMPFEVLEEVVRVLMFGADKYGAENWRCVEDGERRYWEAAIRHLTAIKRGEFYDKESGLTHYGHALCSIIFAFWHSGLWKTKKK